MLNPSDADAEKDDPTIRRCMAFARREGAGGIIVANLFAWRTPHSDELRQAGDPFGKDNRKAIEAIAARSIENGIPIVCAWGCRGALHAADETAIDIMRGVGPSVVLKCLGKTKAAIRAIRYICVAISPWKSFHELSWLEYRGIRPSP